MVTKKKIYRKRPAKMEISATSGSVRLAISCTPEERKMIKMRASFEDKTLNEFVMDCVRAKIKSCTKAHTPNKETAEALDASERGEGLRTHKSIDEMFKFLGI